MNRGHREGDTLFHPQETEKEGEKKEEEEEEKQEGEGPNSS